MSDYIKGIRWCFRLGERLLQWSDTISQDVDCLGTVPPISLIFARYKCFIIIIVIVFIKNNNIIIIIIIIIVTAFYLYYYSYCYCYPHVM